MTEVIRRALAIYDDLRVMASLGYTSDDSEAAVAGPDSSIDCA